MNIKWVQWMNSDGQLKAFAVDVDAELKGGLLRSINGSIIPDTAVDAESDTAKDPFCLTILEKYRVRAALQEAAVEKKAIRDQEKASLAEEKAKARADREAAKAKAKAAQEAEKEAKKTEREAAAAARAAARAAAKGVSAEEKAKAKAAQDAERLAKKTATDAEKEAAKALRIEKALKGAREASAKASAEAKSNKEAKAVTVEKPKPVKVEKGPTIRFGKKTSKVVLGGKILGEFPSEKVNQELPYIVRMTEKSWAVYQDKKRVVMGLLVQSEAVTA
jgi:hypothetical protein